MLDLFNIAKPQGCDIQIFNEVRGTSTAPGATWVKPRGVTHVYMLLIGAGGSGNGTTGGGSGSVTVWYGMAQNVPDILYVQIGGGGTGANTTIIGQFSSGFIQLLRASAASSTTGGTATGAGSSAFDSMGFYQSVAGQNGSSAGITASSTTFLSGGGTAASSLTANYGYDLPASVSAAGYFQMQPIIVGAGGKGTGRGGIGCGGGAGSGVGGPGMVLIASW